VRQAYRLARSAVAHHAPSPQLPADLVEGCEVLASRLHLLDRLPKGGVLAELGTLRGDFARQMLARCEPSRLEIVDIDFSRFDERLDADPRLNRTLGLTTEVIVRFPDAHFDAIYIDADHSFDGVLADARASAPKVKPGGLLIFNDFAHIDPGLGRYGVHRAVSEFAVAARWRMRYLALEPNALYDVALRRPLQHE